MKDFARIGREPFNAVADCTRYRNLEMGVSIYKLCFLSLEQGISRIKEGKGFHKYDILGQRTLSPKEFVLPETLENLDGMNIPDMTVLQLEQTGFTSDQLAKVSGLPGYPRAISLRDGRFFIDEEVARNHREYLSERKSIFEAKARALFANRWLRDNYVPSQLGMRLPVPESTMFDESLGQFPKGSTKLPVD